MFILTTITLGAMFKNSNSSTVIHLWDLITVIYLLQLQPFYGSLDLVWDNMGEPVPKELFTHSHLSWSSIIPYLLPPWLRSMASSLFNLCAWQSSLQVFFGLPLGLAAPTEYSIHFFTKSLSSFCSTCPYHCNLFCCITKIKFWF